MSTHQLVAGVGRTALSVARVRARESARPDALFSDPYARAFLEAFARAAPDEPITSSSPPSLRATLALQVVVRTRFYDEYLLAAPGHGCRQVVLLAAGLDTRAFRLAWPDGVRLFELDLPGVLTFKDAVLAEQGAAPRCERTSLAVDLRADWPALLIAAGFDPAPAARHAGLREDLAGGRQGRVLQDAGGGIQRQDAADWLADHGWQPEVHDIATLATAYGRPISEGSASGFVTATSLGRTSSPPLLGTGAGSQ